jgi:hypothetical protein
MRLVPIFAIEAMAFLLIIVETYLFFNFVVPIGTIPHTLGGYTGLALAKLVLVISLGVLWFVVMIGLTWLYVRSKTRTSPRPSF